MNMVTQPELDAMKRAIEIARECRSDRSDRTDPKVGAVLVRDDNIVNVAYRGELASGDHAEYTLLEKKLGQTDVAGATLITTLEPCISRNEPKKPCADRIIDRQIATVVVGMLDPNPNITGKGVLRLREAGIEVQLFPAELMTQVEELNLDFSRQFRILSRNDDELFESYGDRSLDQWYIALNKIYWAKNSHRGLSYMMDHLVEVVGGLSGFASEKKKPNVDLTLYVPKALAWWFALCGKASVGQVSDMIFRKFPNACPYCETATHNEDICRDIKQEPGRPRWVELEQLASSNRYGQRPQSLSQWLKMFRKIYPVSQTDSYGPTFARLTEELGELAEAVRLFDEEPSFFLSEAADVFAWLMRVENIREMKNNTPLKHIGHDLERGMATSYPDYCLDCEARQCRCPPILDRTRGRIAKEMPAGSTNAFMTSEMRRAMFGA
ncbi:hypothetical protein [Candidatus Poriferisodalis sp.]|uniref:hypothetical protein n=1 Tax=Candidatus Poriferisodalis sp. TaxID=3101277 RepID=UPI003B012498